MFILSRNFLVILLVLLQLFAPLVHAHVGKHFTSAGIHLPGLESRTVGVEAPTLQALDCNFSSSNLIVSIEAGVKNKQPENVVDNADGAYIHQPAFVFNVLIIATDSNFSPHIAAFVPYLYTPRYAPRAPPLF
ncbi:MAG: hypothetical protein ABL903_00300 [Methylococcales bacterium]